MQKNIIVLIGGPGTGKSSILNQLIDKGFCCYPEISREITLEAKKNGIDQLFLADPLLFSRLLLEGRQKQYEGALQEPHSNVFIDRGVPDILAYMHFINQDYPENFTTACEECKYTKIFMLSPWEEIYKIDDARYETYTEAEKVHQCIVDAYRSFGYDPIEVPQDSVENRVDFILNALEDIL
ncbi:ATPase [Flavobacterium faecale]|uniref:ATPase n=1 Tax=Flavobacterium faecale TaxID=1355330 RepID=A0A2S1LD43_9FLAO|nr:AAA family ATPase [Flavobacterium faecale]AWG21621.1 ATPase [Flavobacterium faecale]